MSPITSSEGEVTGQMKLLETLYHLGLVSEEQFHRMMPPRRHQLAQLAESA